MKFATITLNPAIDKTIITTETLKLNTIHQCSTTIEQPGGKGINVAKILKLWNINANATGLIGNSQDNIFQKLFKTSNITNNFINIPLPTRINTTITDGKGQELKINDKGWENIHASPANIINSICSKIDNQSVVAICGSLPPALPKNILTQLINQLHTKHCIIALDSSKDALLAGCKANPTIIKPNQYELEDIIGFAINNQTEIINTIKHLRKKHEIIIATFGNDKAYFADAKHIFIAHPPKVKVCDTTGAGDALLGTFLAHYFPNQTLNQHTIAMSVATASASVECLSTATPNKTRIQALSKLVEIKKLT